MLRKILPHVAIVLSNMYIVFYLIDRVNSAMCFIDNSITKVLLVILAVISTVNAAFLIRDERRRIVRESRRRAQPRPEAPSAQPRPIHTVPRAEAPARRSRFG